MLAERLFSAKKGQGLLAGMVAVLLAFGLLGKYALLPKMHQLQIIKYSPRSTQVQRQAADANFRAWHGAVQTVNLLSVAALLFLLWQSSRPPEAPRLSGWGSGSNTRGRS
jgi:hypothetical protein